MSPTRLHPIAAKKLVIFLLIGFLVQLGLLGYVYSTSQDGKQNLVNSQRAGCERGKKDRIANAAFQRAHATYIKTVTSAESVKEDVKAAARKALKTFKRTSAELTERAKIDCKEAFP